MATYYNEYEPYAAEWLRNLIKKGLIPNGEVDTRSILNVAPDDLRGFTQCHFFAGLGGWAYAARLAGWPDERPLWTGSAPCQPFSTAGQQKGTADERHLWPVFFGLIRACRPPVVMGEQVAAAVGKDWLDGVSSDLEGIGYACGAVVVPACAVDAPHRRDRLWFVADAGRGRQLDAVNNEERAARVGSPQFAGGSGDVADANGGGPRAERGDDGEMRRVQEAQREPEHGAAVSGRGGREDGDVADAGPVGRDGWASPARCKTGANAGVEGRSGADVGHPDAPQCEGECVSGGVHAENHFAECGGRRGHWDTYQWAIGSDGKARRVGSDFRRLVDGFSAGVDGLRTGCYAEKEAVRYEPLALLAHNVPARVGKLRALGNAIVPQVAAEIIGAYMEAYS